MTNEDDMTFDELRAAMEAGEPTTINPGPRPVLRLERAYTCPHFSISASVFNTEPTCGVCGVMHPMVRTGAS